MSFAKSTLKSLLGSDAAQKLISYINICYSLLIAHTYGRYVYSHVYECVGLCMYACVLCDAM